ncbi:MAG: MBL fold metallo-hydrolase [Chloroflexi bacterium]|jgi:glyoxylase-like metal-dependent hydrolase (beta-lactamase superfamily II)|nr:MBL fold metallo-hydrolase [Chloroflexota bacterium]MBT7081379.1 MBL fold metallo-hydrolase [Chloroflexota bacterium]MBT7290336.1 MBL fold metallo-hydrolase [Chloroflexota bacterium]
MEIVPGITQLKIPIPNNPLGNLNAYLLKGKDGYIMVDVGWPTQKTLDILIAKLAEINLVPQDIKSIFITHAHPDHMGLADKFRELYGAKLMLHQSEAPSAAPDRWQVDDLIWKWLLLNGMPESDVDILKQRQWGQHQFTWRVEPDILLKGDERIELESSYLDVLFTPGHSRGHLCLYDPKNKVLIAGDHMLPIITPSISLYPRSAANPLGSYLNSLRSIRNLDVDVVLPSHQNVYHNFNERLDQLIRHHEVRASELIEAMGSASKTAYQIMLDMQWVGASSEVVLGKGLEPIQQMSACAEALAHLEFLRLEGIVKRTVTDDLALFICNEQNPNLHFA